MTSRVLCVSVVLSLVLFPLLSCGAAPAPTTMAALPTDTPAPTEAPTTVPTATPEATSTPTSTPSPTLEPTETPSPTDTSTPMPSPTDTLTPTSKATDTPAPTPTATPVPWELTVNALELPIWGSDDQTHPGRTAVRNSDGSLTTWVPYWGGETASFERICFTAGGDFEVLFGMIAVGRDNGGRDGGFVAVWDQTLQQFFALIITDSYIGTQGPDFWVSSTGETTAVARVRFEGVGSGKPETYTVWDGTSGRELASGQFSSRFAGGELCVQAHVTNVTNDPGGIDVTFTHFAILVPPGTHHVKLR